MGAREQVHRTPRTLFAISCQCIFLVSRVQLFATWTVASQAPLSMGFSRQEYWSGLPCPPPGDLPDPGTEPRSPALQVDSLPSEPPGYTYFKIKVKKKKELSSLPERNETVATQVLNQ